MQAEFNRQKVEVWNTRPERSPMVVFTGWSSYDILINRIKPAVSYFIQKFLSTIIYKNEPNLAESTRAFCTQSSD